MEIWCGSCRPLVSCFHGHLEKSHAAKKNRNKKEVGQHKKGFAVKDNFRHTGDIFLTNMLCIQITKPQCCTDKVYVALLSNVCGAQAANETQNKLRTSNALLFILYSSW